MGAPLGNGNAVIQGVYARGILAHELCRIPLYEHLTGVDSELLIARILLERTLEAESCYATRVAMERETEGESTVPTLHLPVERIAIGRVWYELGRHREAIDAAQAALALRPDSARPLFVIAMSRVMLGECEEASKIYREVLKLHPDDPATLGYLSGALASAGQLEEGLKMAHEAVRVAPGSALPHCFLGHRYVNLGRYEEAAQSYERALTLDPTYRWAMWGYAESCLLKGDFDKSLSLLCDAIPRATSAMHTSSGARQNLCRLLRGVPKPKDLGPLDSFIDRIEGIIGNADQPAIVLENLALACMHAPQRRDLELALAYATRAVEVTGWRSAETVATLASVHFGSGEVGQAIRLLEDHVDADRRGDQREFLQHCRDVFRPDIASFTSVDVLFASAAADPDALLEALEAFEAQEVTPERRATAAYFRARLIELDGLCEEAAEAFGAATTNRAETMYAQVPRVGPCIEGSDMLRNALTATCHAALAASAPDGVLRRSLAALEALARPSDEIPAVGRVHVWWILGPFENTESLSEDLVPSQSVDLYAPLQRDGKVFTWRRQLSSSMDVDLAAIFGPLKKTSALLYSELEVSSDIGVQMELEVDDQVSFNLNGAEVYRFEGIRMDLPRKHVFGAKFQAGINRLLLRIRNIDGGWSITLRLVDANGSPVRLRQHL